MKSTILSSKKMIVILAIILTIVLSSCNLQKNTTAENTIGNNNVAQAKTVDNSNTSLTVMNDAEEKFKAVDNEIHMMKHNGMENVSKLYTDLTLVKSVDKGSDEIITGMGDEDWLYSPTYDTTVIVCKSLNTPAYAFKGKQVSKEEIQKVREMTKEMMNNSSTDMMGSGEMMMGGDHNMEMGNKMKKDEMMMNKGEYIPYSPEAVKNAKGKIVLFFHADWCPSCKATDKDILSKKVPNDLTVLKADFDKEIELKQKYGVLTQTTFVQIDKDGNEITKWVGGDLEGIISSVK